MLDALYARAERVSDFVCWHIRIITVVLVSTTGMLLSAKAASSGHPEWATYVTYTAALLGTLVVAFMGRLPTSAIFGRFMSTYKRGPWTGTVPMPTLKSSSEREPRIKLMSEIMYRLDDTCDALIKRGNVDKKVVYAWANSLAKISAELL